MKHSSAEILQRIWSFPEVDQVAGITFDGRRVWVASGDKLTRSTRPAER